MTWVLLAWAVMLGQNEKNGMILYQYPTIGGEFSTQLECAQAITESLDENIKAMGARREGDPIFTYSYECFTPPVLKMKLDELYKRPQGWVAR